MSNIKTPADFGRALKQPYAWPGGYPTFFLTNDGAAICHQCAMKEGKGITQAIRDNDRQSGWKVEAIDVNWEDAQLTCEHCGKRIESAYGDDANDEQTKMDAQVARALGSH